MEAEAQREKEEKHEEQRSKEHGKKLARHKEQEAKRDKRKQQEQMEEKAKFADAKARHKNDDIGGNVRTLSNFFSSSSVSVSLPMY